MLFTKRIALKMSPVESVIVAFIAKHICKIKCNIN